MKPVSLKVRFFLQVLVAVDTSPSNLTGFRTLTIAVSPDLVGCLQIAFRQATGAELP